MKEVRVKWEERDARSGRSSWRCAEKSPKGSPRRNREEKQVEEKLQPEAEVGTEV